MNKANTQKLYSDFPLLYRDATNKQSCMQFGFQCNDGWFELIHKLSADIEAEAKALGLDQNSDAWPNVNEVKEKFGTLKFYCDAGKKRDGSRSNLEPEATGQLISFRPWPNVQSIRALIKDAEKASATICEGCGCHAELKKDGWWRVLCDKCEAERQKRNITNGSKYSDSQYAYKSW